MCLCGIMINNDKNIMIKMCYGVSVIMCQCRIRMNVLGYKSNLVSHVYWWYKDECDLDLGRFR